MEDRFYYALVQSDDRVPTQALVRQFGPERIAIGIAKIDLSWCDVSRDLSLSFLNTVVGQLEQREPIDVNDISQLARLGFDKTCSLVDPQERDSGITGQYVLAYCSEDMLRVSWIGEMYLTVWDNGTKQFEIKPHIRATYDPNFWVNTRFFRRKVMREDHTFPESAEPCQIRPGSSIYLGNRELGKTFPPGEGESRLRKIIQSRDSVSLEQNCQQANEWAAKLWLAAEGQEGLRSVFANFGSGVLPLKGDCAKQAWERGMRCKDTTRNLS